MSRYIPTFDGSNRWLEDGKVLPSATLKTELEAVKTAEDANAAQYAGTSDLPFKKGMGIRYDVADKAFNKVWPIDDCGASDEYAITKAGTAGTTTLVPGDTVDDFQTVKLLKGCQAFGKKMMLLEIVTYGFDAAAGTDYVLHPSVATAAQHCIFRESSLPADEYDGQHPFARGTDAGYVTYLSDSVTLTRRAYVAMRNLNDSFSFRVGTTLANGAGGEILVRVLEAWD